MTDDEYWDNHDYPPELTAEDDVMPNTKGYFLHPHSTKGSNLIGGQLIPDFDDDEKSHTPKGKILTPVSDTVARAIEKDGDIPNIAMRLNGLSYDKSKIQQPFEEWIDDLKSAVAVVAYNYPVDVKWAIDLMGIEVRYNRAKKECEWKHPQLTDDQWKSAHRATDEPSAKRLARYVNYMCVCIRKEGQGPGRPKLDVVRPCDPSRVDEAGARLNNALESLTGYKNEVVPSVHPFATFFDKLARAASQWTYSQRDYAIWLSKNWMLHIPYLQFDYRNLAVAAGSNITGGLALRLAEAKYGLRPFMQKLIVHISGPTDLGKTTMLKALCDPSMREFLVENFGAHQDTNKMEAAIIGQHQVIWDDFTGQLPQHLDYDSCNRFISSTNPIVELKYKNTDKYQRSAWMMATGNAFHYIPNRSVTADVYEAYERRWLCLPVDLTPEGVGMQMGKRVAAAEKYCKQIAFTAMVGGYLRWLQATKSDDRADLDPHALGIEVDKSIQNERAEARRSVSMHPDILSPDQVLDIIDEKGLPEFTKEFYCELAGVMESTNGYFKKHGKEIERRLAARGWKYKIKGGRAFVRISNSGSG